MRLAAKSVRAAVDAVFHRIEAPQHYVTTRNNPCNKWYYDCLSGQRRFDETTVLDLTGLHVRQAILTAMRCLGPSSCFPILDTLIIGSVAAGRWPHDLSTPNDPAFASVLSRLWVPKLKVLQVLMGEHLGQDREDPPQLQVLGAHMSNICTLRIRQRCSRGLARNRRPLPGSLDEDLRGIGSFAAVTALDLNTCTGLTPKGLAHVAAMTRLRHLALRGTSMGSPVAFGAFGEVGALSPLTSIAAMTQLVKLDMEHCTELQSLSMQCFSVLRQLTALSLATTGLCEPSIHQCSPCAVLACLTKLRVLNVNDTFIAAGLTKLSVLTCLERLHLGGNSCGSDIVRSMSGCDDSSIGQLTVLTRLTRLQVPACTRLSDDGYRAVGQMTSLQELDLCDTFVKDEQVKYLTALQRLKALAIDSSPEPSQQPITYSTGLWALTVLRNLRFIDLGSGHLSVRTGKRFRRQRRIRLHRDIERCTEENRLFWNSNSFFRE